MVILRVLAIAACALGGVGLAAQMPAVDDDAARGDQRAGAAQPPAPAAPGQRGRGRGRGRGAVQVMVLTTTEWRDGGAIPMKYAQPGAELSPPLAWLGVPEGVQSFVLMVSDLDTLDRGEPVLHWLVWNIPGSATRLAEGIPHGPELPDGARQVSVSGPYYRGPAVPPGGPAHHYVFEALYALDTMLDVPAVSASPRDTRAAVVAGMADHIRGKGVLVGLFRDK